MSQKRETGSRIREQRLDRGLRQAAVAESVGISASYLNLIEHNRRRIGGKLLADLARVLEVDAAFLTEGADSDLLDQLRHAAAAHNSEVEVARVEEFAARYPGWAELISAQLQRSRTLEERLHVLSERVAHDPQLADYLHEVISTVTSIRSSSSILVGQESLDADWQRRFHENIDTDSRRLASTSEALIAYLETPQEEANTLPTPLEEVEAFLSGTGFHLAHLERVGGGDTTAHADLSTTALDIYMRYCAVYRKDAVEMPLLPFLSAAERLDFDPLALALEFSVDVSAVLRRLAALPPDKSYGPYGLVACDASGAVTLQKAIPEFGLPRSGGSCPLWPVFGAFARPAQPIQTVVELSGAIPARFMCYAVADVAPVRAADLPPVLQATMLVLPDSGGAVSKPLLVGTSCRICARDACQARREPAISGVST